MDTISENTKNMSEHMQDPMPGHTPENASVGPDRPIYRFDPPPPESQKKRVHHLGIHNSWHSSSGTPHRHCRM